MNVFFPGVMLLIRQDLMRSMCLMIWLCMMCSRILLHNQDLYVVGCTIVVGDKPVKNDAGEMSMSEDSKQKAWLEHYQRLLNVEFDWDPDHLSSTTSGRPTHPNHH